MNDKIADINLNIFRDNKASLYGDKVASYPIRLELLNQTKEKLKNSNHVSPGHFLNFSIDLCMLDHFSQIVTINEKFLLPYLGYLI
jgi:hypothetical protein